MGDSSKGFRLIILGAVGLLVVSIGTLYVLEQWPFRPAPPTDVEKFLTMFPPPTPTGTPTPTLPPTPTPTLYPMPTATPTPLPTPTPTPTLTPTPEPTPTPTPTPTVTPTPIPVATPTLTLSDMLEMVRPAVVRVYTPLLQGSGVIYEVEAYYEGRAYVLTNYHVIEGAADEIYVEFNDAWTYPGILVGTDPTRDLAVLTICCSAGFMPLPFGDAANLPAGTDVIAMGYSLGIEGEASVTRGIVSAIRYDSAAFRWLIQTDTPINPGNSGGPLLSTSGEILGINTFVIRSIGPGISVEGFGFAISEVTINEVLPNLVSGQ